MTYPVFVPADFRVAYPGFANETRYPDELLAGYAVTAQCFVSDNALCATCEAYAINLLVAHLAYLGFLISRGQTTVGVKTGATIDKVAISLQAPPMRGAWDSWLLTSPYGQQFLALVTAEAAGGDYYGGSAVRAGYRNEYGRFG